MIRLLKYTVAAFVLMATPALADPVTILINAVTAVAIKGFAVEALYLFATMMALSELAKALAPKMDDRGVDGGYDVSGPDPAAHQQIIYGKTRVGGVIVFKDTTDNDKYLHMVIAIAGHECESLEEIHLDDERLIFNGALDNNYERWATGSVKVGKANSDTNIGKYEAGRSYEYNQKVYATFHNGASNQTADANLVSRVPRWTNNHRLRGIAYCYIRLTHDPEVFTSGEPRITFVVKGKKVYNPDTEVTQWSNNPALCLRDYLTSDYGLNCDSTEIDDQTFIQAADDCGYGGIALEYKFDSATANSQPPTGFVRFNKTTPILADRIYINNIDANGILRTTPIANLVGQDIFFESASDPTEYMKFSVTGILNYSGYRGLIVTPQFGSVGNILSINMNYVPSSNLIISANNELVAGAKYQTNGAFTTEATPENVINSLATSAAGNVFYSMGKFQFYAGVPRTATVTLTDDDVVSGIKVQTKRSRRETYNEIHGLYKGHETAWQKSDYPVVISQNALDEDKGEPSIHNLDLLFTGTASMAKRIAKVMLLRSRQQVQVQGIFGLKAAQLAVGDWVTYQNNRMGIDATFEVVSWSLSPNTQSGVSFDLSLQQISDTVYSWTGDDEPSEISPKVVDNTFGRFVAPLTLQLTVTSEIISEHLIAILKITTTSVDSSLVENVQVQYKLTSQPDTEYKTVGIGALGEFEVRDLAAGNYTVRARAINSVGTRGEYVYATKTITLLQAPPDDVTEYAGDLNNGNMTLFWKAVTSPDLSYYLIRHARETTGATMANATTSVAKVSRPATSVTVAAREGTFLIRAYSKTGQPSANAASIVVTSDMLPSYANNYSQSEHTSFSGAKSNTQVDSNRLTLTTYSTQPSSGTYDFSNYIDTGSARLAHVSMVCAVIRDSGTSLWDDLTGPLDSMAGLWDDLTDGEDIVDTDVEFYVSTTSDDPSGTPTWSDYVQFKAGDYYGRAFRFRVKLISTGDGVTPSIGELTARVRYN